MNIPSIDFSPSSPTENSIEIISLDELYKRKNDIDHNPEQPHRMGFSMFIYIKNKTGNHFIDFNQWPYKKGSLIFINKNQVNAFDLSNRPQGNAVLFTDDFTQKIQSNMRVPLFSPLYFKNDYSPILQASSSLQKSCELLLLETEKEMKRNLPDSLIIMSLFSTLLLMIERERSPVSKGQLSKKSNENFTEFSRLLEKQFTQTRNASDYADQLHITYKSLNQLCKRATGLTAKQLIDTFTILEAKRRLIIEKKHVQELAFELGFDEVTNFTKYFKKHTQLPPSHFQKNN